MVHCIVRRMLMMLLVHCCRTCHRHHMRQCVAQSTRFTTLNENSLDKTTEQHWSHRHSRNVRSRITCLSARVYVLTYVQTHHPAYGRIFGIDVPFCLFSLESKVNDSNFIIINRIGSIDSLVCSLHLFTTWRGTQAQQTTYVESVYWTFPR